jgi:ABC-type glycerol-3-phosphate transport system substrate-binding protein
MPQIAIMSAQPFAGLTGPLIASGGTLDDGNVGTGEVFPWQWRMSGYTESPPGDKYYLALENSDHYLGGLICRDNKGGPADPEAVEVVRAAQTAFLDGYVKQDAAALDWLRATDWQALSNGRATFETK